jgi:hypothetical protein
MSSTTSNRGAASTLSGVDDLEIVREDEDTGWLFFAASVLGIAGFMRIIDSIWAFRYNGALPEGLKDGVLGDNLTTYAWTWLLVGALLILSSIIIVSRSQFGRWVGMIAAAIGAISAITWMPYYPVWSLVYISLAVFVLYALAAHGGREG